MRPFPSFVLALPVLLALDAAGQSPAIRYPVSPSRVSAVLADHHLAIADDRIRLAPAVTSSVAEPVLRIASAERNAEGEISLRLACRSSSECLPFFAIVSMPDREAALASLRQLGGAAPVTAAASSPAQSSPGVSVGGHVVLLLSDRQMRIQIEAVAIDTGSSGHEIRVASLDRKHTYRGIVTGPASVQGDLP